MSDNQIRAKREYLSRPEIAERAENFSVDPFTIWISEYLPIWFRRWCLACFTLSLLFLCSCATQPRVAPAKRLPAEVPINYEAGRGGQLVVMLKFNGEELPFLVDTGAPVTTFDKSLEGKLSKGYGEAYIQLLGDREKQMTKFHDAPELVLGETPMALGKFVCTYDFKRKFMGILGMDCLQHYCIQLDFETGKMQFLDSGTLNPDELGQCFAITVKNRYPMIESAGLISQSVNPMIDLGCNIDAMVDQGTNRMEGIYLPENQWNNQTYTDLIVVSMEGTNLMGLRFLARHLVTLDFPNQRVFLKQTRADSMGVSDAESPRKSALSFLMKLREDETLPGWMKTSNETVCFQSSTSQDSVTFELWKQSEPAVFEYRVERISKTNDWKLIKASRTDSGGEIVEELHINDPR